MTDVTWEGRDQAARFSLAISARTSSVSMRCVCSSRSFERRLGHYAGREKSTTWSRTITDVAIDMTVERGAAGR
jgi:hypothetical protein